MKFRIPLVFTLLASGALALVAPGCHIGRPFQGPGFDPERGVTAPGAGATVVVGVTYGKVAPGSGRRFSEQLGRVRTSLEDQPGLIGHAVRKHLFGREVWTLSVWTDEDSLDTFLEQAVHREASREGGIPRTAVRSRRAVVPASELPLSWSWAEELLADELAEPQAPASRTHPASTPHR